MSAVVPYAWLDGCVAAHRRLEAAVAPVTDEVARQPSLLPGWTVGHLLTHLARNADSHTRRVLAAQRGEVAPQYAGGPAQREHEIGTGSTRPARELRADVIASHGALERAWAATTEGVWTTGLGLRNETEPVTLADVVLARWREVEVHRVDLGLDGAGWESLATDFVDAEWERAVATLGERVPAGTAVVLVPGDRPSRAAGAGPTPVVVRGSPCVLLGWMLGRGGDPSWPELPPWE